MLLSAIIGALLSDLPKKSGLSQPRPEKASDRVKTNRRDSTQLARLYRAGELTFITVPDAEDEAVRDLVRARFSAIKDQRHARQKVKGMLLRQGLSYSGKTSWGPAHLNYLARLKMPYRAQQIAFEEYKQAVTVATDRVGRLTQGMEEQLPAWKAQLRLCGRFQHLRRKGKKTQVIVTAIARELSGFVWAIACTAMGKAPVVRTVSGTAAKAARKSSTRPSAKPMRTKTSGQSKRIYQLEPDLKYRRAAVKKV